ncbi:MAG TPA: phage tail tube protein [Pyrinomonadaceae bacterium]|nr:phage tail tube protein [Pyrinomonadaceae bacterium]
MAQPDTFKQKNVFAAFSYFRQAAIGTPLGSDDLTMRLPLPRDAKPLPTRRVTREETRDCTGRFLMGRRLTSRLALWSLRMDATAELTAWLLGLAFGDAGEPAGTGPSTHQITRLVSDQLPATSFLIGAEDSDEPAELYSDMVLNTLDIEATVRGKVSLAASFVGNADVDIVADYEPPACANILPVYAEDCALVIGGTDYTEHLRSFRYNRNNGLYSNDDPFPFDAVDLVRLERGNDASGFQLVVYGTKAHPLYAQAAAENTLALSLRIGSAAEGTSIIAAGAQLTLQDAPVGYAGEASRSVINLDATPVSVGGAAPDRVTFVGALDDRLLTVPA